MKKSILFFNILLSVIIANSLEAHEKQVYRSNDIKISIDSIRHLSWSYNLKGNQARLNTKFKEAIQLHHKALRYAQEISDTTAIIIINNNLGTDLRRIDAFDKAGIYFLYALKLTQQHLQNKTCRKSRAVALNGLGNVQLSLGDCSKALKYFKQALDIEVKLKSNVGQAIDYNNMGAAYACMGKKQEALIAYRKSLDLNQQIKSNVGIALTKKLLGELYIQKGEQTKGLKYIREAVSTIKQSKDIWHRVMVQETLCKVLLDLNQLDAVQQEIDALIQGAQSINSLKYLENAYFCQAILYEKQRRFESALRALRESNTYKDTRLKDKNEAKIIDLESRYELMKANERYHSLLKEKALILKEHAVKMWTSSLAGLLSFLFLIYFIFLYVSKKRYAQNMSEISFIKTSFFNNVAHEFRTPLSLIKGPLNNLIEKYHDEEDQTYLNMMKRNTDRLTFFVERLLTITKIDSGKVKMKIVTLDLAQYIVSIVKEFVEYGERNGYRISTSIAPTGLCQADVTMIESLISNISASALKYTPKKEKISIIGKRQGDWYRLDIINKSPDMSQTDLKNLLKQFYLKGRLLKDNTNVGLALIKRVSDLYGAKFAIHLTEEQVFSFTIMLPIKFKQHAEQVDVSTLHPNRNLVLLDVQEEIADIAKVKIRNEMENEEKPKSNGISKTDQESKEGEKANNLATRKTILVAEDNSDMRLYIKIILSKKYDVILAKDGVDGYELSQSKLPDLIISDVMMPNMDGYEFCDKIKNNKKTKHIPFIILSALSDTNDELNGLRHHANDYISKPFSSEKLQLKIHNLLEVQEQVQKQVEDKILLNPNNILVKEKEPSDEFVCLLKEVLSKDVFSPEFTVEVLCKKANMSRSQLYRRLKIVTGMSAAELIKTTRLHQAEKLLINSKCSIGEAATLSGFNELSYFTRIFKRHYGMTPSMYRIQAQKGNTQHKEETV